MGKQTLGEKIAQLRREKQLTQAELAKMMGVTDKAVSKWERNLSCPDVSSIPRLAEILGLSPGELIEAKAAPVKRGKRPVPLAEISFILRSIALAMGAAVTVLSFFKELDMNSGFGLLGIGLFCLALSHMVQGRAGRDKQQHI